MNIEYFERFAPVILSLSERELNGKSQSLFKKMRLLNEGDLEVCCFPFEYINPKARVVLVGITPGRTQLINAIREARKQLDRGADATTAIVAAKRVGAFSGTMRPNLVALLDCIGVNRWLKIASSDVLFGSSADLVHSTSVLQNPVFIKGKNYNGTPNMTRNLMLQKQLLTGFGSQAQEMADAIFVPLGDKVTEALKFLVKEEVLDSNRILEGLPHPSGANAERIAYFLGRKSRSELSSRTSGMADKLDSARDDLKRKMSLLS